MTFDAHFAYNVLLPLSSAAYALPLSKGELPKDYEQVSSIHIDRKTLQPRRFINRYQYGWVYLNDKDRILVVAYRGTDDFADVVKDVCIDAEPYKCIPEYGTVHMGFQAVYFAVRDSVIAACKEFSGKYDRLILTGHSLGAAVSELSAPDLYYQHLDAKPEVVNFAAPRVGKQDFADKYTEDRFDCIRIVNKWDTVPRVPSLWTGYRHVGDSVVINGGFTLDAIHAHRLDGSYRLGLQRLTL